MGFNIKRFNESNYINELEKILNRFNSLISLKNRNRLVNNSKLSDDFIHYFHELIDSGWDISINTNNYYLHIILKNVLKKEGLKSEVNSIIDTMTELHNRLNDEDLDSKFIIQINGKAQQIQNPNSYRTPIYKFTGIGDNKYLKYYMNGIYSDSEYVFGKIDLHII